MRFIPAEETSGTEVELKSINVRSAMKISLFFSTALSVVGIVLFLVIYILFWLMGTLSKLNSAFGSLLTDNGSIVNLGIMLLFAVCFGVFNIALGTFMGTAGAIIYNRSVKILGGLKFRGEIVSSKSNAVPTESN